MLPALAASGKSSLNVDLLFFNSSFLVLSREDCRQQWFSKPLSFAWTDLILNLHSFIMQFFLILFGFCVRTLAVSPCFRFVCCDWFKNEVYTTPHHRTSAQPPLQDSHLSIRSQALLTYRPSKVWIYMSSFWGKCCALEPLRTGHQMMYRCNAGLWVSVEGE